MNAYEVITTIITLLVIVAAGVFGVKNNKKLILSNLELTLYKYKDQLLEEAHKYLQSLETLLDTTTYDAFQKIVLDNIVAESKSFVVSQLQGQNNKILNIILKYISTDTINSIVVDYITSVIESTDVYTEIKSRYDYIKTLVDNLDDKVEAEIKEDATKEAAITAGTAEAAVTSSTK